MATGKAVKTINYDNIQELSLNGATSWEKTAKNHGVIIAQALLGGDMWSYLYMYVNDVMVEAFIENGVQLNPVAVNRSVLFSPGDKVRVAVSEASLRIWTNMEYDS